MSRPQPSSLRNRLRVPAALLIAWSLLVVAPGVQAHIVPPEKFHPVAESYRRLCFLLNLNPVPWDLVEADVRGVATGYAGVSKLDGQTYLAEASKVIASMKDPQASEPPDRPERRAAARHVFELSTRAVASTLALHLNSARATLSDYRSASRQVEEARQIWAAFEHEVRFTDRPSFQRLGQCWLKLSEALGNPGVLGIGERRPDLETFREESDEIIEYLDVNFGERFHIRPKSRLAPLPARSATFDAGAATPVKLPPGSNINKQLPRPRQILNMAERGVDEHETPLIALGDMAFDSPIIFGEPARSLTLSCNSCHNKGVTNPNFRIPGLSTRPGTLDVSNNFFAPHANNAHFAALDIPDLRGIRFTAPYGRNGRFASLREFVRNVIINEFNGPEPDPLLLDSMVAYILEFDFLPNPAMNSDGTLNGQASEQTKRGEKLFNQPFEQMGDRSCATCHIPSDHFLDRRRHDIGSVMGTGTGSKDRNLDTPTLLSSLYTAPYFHDGSQPTLASVVDWFDRRYILELNDRQRSDLTAYLESVGSGTEAYEDNIFTLESELEEFSFFLSTYEFLRSRKKTQLINITFQTIASELRAHKWTLQNVEHMSVLDRMVDLMDSAYEANRRGDREGTDASVRQYREIYSANAEYLQ